MARLSKKVLLAVAIAIAAISVNAEVPKSASTFGQGVAVNSAGSIAGVNVGIGFSTSQVGIGSTRGSGLAAGAASGFGIGSQNTGSGAGFVASQALNTGYDNKGSLAATNQAAFRGASTSSGAFDITSESSGSTNVGKVAGQAAGAAGVSLDGGVVNVQHVNDVGVTVGNKQSALFTSSGQVTAGDAPYVAPYNPHYPSEIKEEVPSIATLTLIGGPTGTTNAGIIGSTTSGAKQAFTVGGIEANGASSYSGPNGFASTVAGGQYASQSRPGQSVGYGVAQSSGLGVGDYSTSGPTSSKVGFTSYGANGITGSSNNFGTAQTNAPAPFALRNVNL